MSKTPVYCDLCLKRPVLKTTVLADGGVAAVCRKCADGKPAAFRRDERLGRNSPCSCGSGKKFKKCCGRYANQES